MPGRFDRQRDDEGRFMSGPRGGRHWQDDDRDERDHRFSRGQDRPRDDQGRFMSDDDDRDFRGGGRGRDERGRFADDDHGWGRRGDWRERDEYGRFESRDDARYGRGGEDRGAYGGGDDYRRGENYGRGGDYGRGDDYRRGDDYGRSDDYRRGDEYGPRGYEGDRFDERFGGRGGSPERDDYGRFASGEDDRSHRGSAQGRGWHGDSQGHSEAARQRDQGSRYEEDDDRGGRNRGRGSRGGGDHRGWFGDPRGHAAAARLGWRHRQ